MTTLSPEQLIASNPSKLSAGHLMAVQTVAEGILNDPGLIQFRSSMDFQQRSGATDVAGDRTPERDFALLIAYRMVNAAASVSADHFGKAETESQRASIRSFVLSALSKHHNNVWVREIHQSTSAPTVRETTAANLKKEYAPTDPEVLRRVCQRALGR